MEQRALLPHLSVAQDRRLLVVVTAWQPWYGFPSNPSLQTQVLDGPN
jgi:hypothetical protein